MPWCTAALLFTVWAQGPPPGDTPPGGATAGVTHNASYQLDGGTSSQSNHVYSATAKENDWNTLDIESRTGRIRVKLNGHMVAEHPGDPARSQTGPIGLQLHDQVTTVMFRSVRIREIQ